MAEKKASPYVNLMSSIKGVADAHQAITAEISDKAQKSHNRIEESRKLASLNRKLTQATGTAGE